MTPQAAVAHDARASTPPSPSAARKGSAGRAIFALAFTIVHSAIWSTICGITAFVPKGGPLVLWMARRCWAPGILWAAGSRVRTEGREHVQRHRPAIYLSNHQSWFDILALFVSVDTDFRFVSKTSVFFVPLLGWAMYLAGFIPINRSNRAKAMKSLEKAGKRIRNGISITMFPEGTRSRDGRILPFKKGPFVLALKAGVPVVPIAIEGSRHALPKHSLRVVPGEIHVRIGAPIETKDLTDADRDRLMSDVRDFIVTQNRALGGLGAAD